MTIQISLKRVTFLSSFGFLITLALACASSGCVTIEEHDDFTVDCGDDDDGDDGDTTIVVVTDGDDGSDEEPPVERVRVDMAFNGLTSLTRGIGEQDIPVFCFTAVATADVEVRRLRMFIGDIGESTAASGLVDTAAATPRPNFTDIKVLKGIQVMAGPRDVSTAGDDIYQPLVFTDVFVLEAHQPAPLCVYLDVADNAALDGDEVQIQLGSPMLGDMVRVDDGTPILVEDIHPSTGMVGQFTALAADEPTGPIVPMSAPIVSTASLPTNTLTNGTVTAYRFTITARAESDVFVKKLSFAADVASASPSVYLSNPRLRVFGTGSDLPAASDTYVVAPELCGNDVDAPTYPCWRIVLDEPLGIAAGTSVTLDLRMQVNGPLASGDAMTSFLAMYSAGLQQGPLSGTGLGTGIQDGGHDAILWSNDGLWHYNGDPVVVSASAGQLVRP